MSKSLNANLCRRDLLRVLTGGAGAAAVGSVPLAGAATPGAGADKRKRARYQPNSPDVRNFYRVNRYPPQR